MPTYRALRGFSYLADEAEHLAAVAGELAYEAGHRTRVEAGQVVDNLPAWVVSTLTQRGHIVDAGAPVAAPVEPQAAEPPPAAPEPEPETPEPVIDYTTDAPAATEPVPDAPAEPEATP